MADAVDELDRGRDAYERRAWLDAYTSPSRAHEASPLRAEDLELLAELGLQGRYIAKYIARGAESRLLRKDVAQPHEAEKLTQLARDVA